MAQLPAAGYWRTAPGIALKVTDGFDLAAVDRRSHPGWTAGKAEAEAFMAERGALLSELQERFYANGKGGAKNKLLLILQGLDTSGKGGISRHVLGMVDPQGVHLRSFGVPTKEELSHHFLWRVKKELPEPGQIGVFDRSHYEDVLVGRVDELAPADEIEKRYDQINAWEKSLVDEGYTLIKVALMHSHSEQGLRLAERLARPDKHWKYNPSDIDTRLKWDAYQEAYQIMFDRTSTAWAPWFVVPADRKWYARLAVTELLTQALLDFKQDWPKPRWKLATQQRRLAATMTDEDIATAKLELATAVEEAEAEIVDYAADITAVDRVGELDAGDRVTEPAPAEPEEPAAPSSSPSAPEKSATKPKKKGKKSKKGKKGKKSKKK